jgi:hypothetical protein
MRVNSIGPEGREDKRVIEQHLRYDNKEQVRPSDQSEKGSD